ncbi:MAG: pyridoxamine 5'-phosphate oxidase family protein [Rhodospirillaceae bacterium]|jgi:hypothetical protein|nr:pyridoxamine 5'-phosphate oxidase family protein [Rhodospirillaceae bacterium]MBT5896281.1 pyridoxamine 5'-phosphate oxidase family protein [Rhodospirillaceae bacterium]MBT6428623.1 pyridoxamine 5'-phosphate oxidase family protein [Rhodospirillaceae bacterium]MBT7759733.1 pyridoxamine 5'-phosphate oxidase family protein [Rhodospirillaceae bacterium]
MSKIPEALHEPINTAFPQNVCLVGTIREDGFPHVSPRGSIQVVDGDTLGLWDRGGRASSDALEDGAKLMVYFRNPALSAVARGGNGLLPVGGIARFYGTAELCSEGAAYEQVWNNMVQPERDADPDKKGFAVLIRVERSEDLRGGLLPEDLALPES